MKKFYVILYKIAIELGETESAMISLSIVVAGTLTVVGAKELAYLEMVHRAITCNMKSAIAIPYEKISYF